MHAMDKRFSASTVEHTYMGDQSGDLAQRLVSEMERKNDMWRLSQTDFFDAQALAEAQIAALNAEKQRKRDDLERLETRTDVDEQAIVRTPACCVECSWTRSQVTWRLPARATLARPVHMHIHLHSLQV